MGVRDSGGRIRPAFKAAALNRPVIENLAAGLLLSTVVAGAGWRFDSLTARGALAAVCIGTAIIGGASWLGALLLGTFFVSSNVISRISPSASSPARLDRRDWRQVLANGGVAAVAALTAPWFGEEAVLIMVAGSLAAATADTWATEIGSRSGRTPRLLLSRRPVPVGVSGGVTLPGTVGSVGGALGIGLVTAAGISFVSTGAVPVAVGLVVTAAGIGGSLVDSLLGETAQQRRYCETCAQTTEARIHRCGSATIHAAGIRWMDNDLVNVACTAAGLVVSALGIWILR
jgi:uncharacterized protein (TIGR00297 family)